MTITIECPFDVDVAAAEIQRIAAARKQLDLVETTVRHLEFADNCYAMDGVNELHRYLADLESDIGEAIASFEQGEVAA